MGLRVWDQLNDPYDNTQQADNWARVDYHDHTPGRGTQIPTDGIEDGAITPEKLSTVVTVASFIPVSTVLSYAGPSPLQDGSAVAPDGFVFADGLLYDGTLAQYATLWSVIGTRFGGSGISAFAVPNLCHTTAAGSEGRTPFGVRTGGMALGSLGGQVAVTLTGAESGVAAHSHSVNNAAHMNDGGGTFYGYVSAESTPITDHGVAANGTHHLINTSLNNATPTNAVNAHDNMPPYQAVNYIIKL